MFLRRLLWGAFFLLPVSGGGKKIYVIGWQNSPPYQVLSNGEPSGIAIDLVKEAARRRGIQLNWVHIEETSESILRNKKVDLWPLITITPARRNFFHISEPYIAAEHTLLVRADSAFHSVADLTTGRVALANSSIDGVLLHNLLPQARPMARKTTRNAIEDVCLQRADATLIDVYTAINALLTQRGCENGALRWIPVPDGQTQMGVGATFEAASTADEIRDEIGAMARENKVEPIARRWGFTPAQSLVSLGELLDEKRRVARLAVAAGLFALLFILASLQTIRLIRERDRGRRTGKALREADRKLELLTNNLKELVLAYDMDRKLIYANPAVERLTGYSVEECKTSGFIPWVHPDHRTRILSYWDGLFEGRSYEDEEYLLVTKRGVVKWVNATWGPILDESGRQVGVQGSEYDITDRKRAEEALRESQVRNMQSQKMEGIGRLAGGVAHDFNNLLTVINGYAELLLMRAAPDSPESAQLEQIRNAGTRAADLTKQLLAFSRKQMMNFQPLDLNAVVASCEPMFQRLLGEEVQLLVKTHPGLGLVMADAGQVNQVLMNLLLNARDAMPGGGEVFVETANVEIDEAYVAEHPEAVTGPAVMLAVSDGGAGMDEETKKNIFEPFFTTKGTGAGTGLGLATVYGIVKQSQGWIDLNSELGEGTSFKIYLPRISKGQSSVGQGGAPVVKTETQRLGGSETVLLVEDEEEVRKFAASVLEAYGYQVLEAADGRDALGLAENYTGPIDVLLTDVVMPGMNGRQLADRLKEGRPGIKVLYTSGYTEDVIAHRGVLEADLAYLAKPYSREMLGMRMRKAIGR